MEVRPPSMPLVGVVTGVGAPRVVVRMHSLAVRCVRLSLTSGLPQHGVSLLVLVLVKGLLMLVVGTLPVRLLVRACRVERDLVGA